MNQLEIFKNEMFGEIRIIEINNEPWFIGKDVAECLGYKDTDQSIRKHVDDEDKLTRQINGSDQTREFKLINESGLYSLIMSSKLEKAKEFKKWVTSEVLPSIRKHGAYMTPQKIEEVLLNPDKIIQLSKNLKNEQARNKELRLQNSYLKVETEIMKPKAEYFDELVDRNLLTNLTDTAKMLNIKRKDFIKFLIDKKFLYRDKKGNLKPHANKNSGLFEIKESKNDKTKWAGTQTLITPKGRETFRLLMLESA